MTVQSLEVKNRLGIEKFPIRVLLIDDQKLIGEVVKRMLEGIDDLYFEYCDDPSKAIDVAIKFRPTVILQDLVMPEMDGLVLVRYFRANSQTKEIPVIVLSAKEEASVKAEAFLVGASDYMVKLPEKEELIARLTYHSRGYIRLLERNDAFSKLEESQKRLEGELNEAAGYVKSLLPAFLDEEIKTNWRFIPSAQLGGDAFGYHWIDKDHLAIYLLDVCGHGVGAALLSISIMNVLKSCSLLGCDFLDPASVLSSLNEAFPMEKHNDMFFTIWYGVYKPSSQKLNYCSGGHPPALLLSNGEVVELKTDGPLVGALSKAQFKAETHQINDKSSLFLFSDGAYEIHKNGGGMMNFDEFKEIVISSARSQSKEIDFIYERIKKISAQTNFIDDFSLLQVSF